MNLSEIASSLIKAFSFNKEEIEVEKRKALQYKAENQRILFT